MRRSGEMGRRHSRRQVRPHKSPPPANGGEQMGNAPRQRKLRDDPQSDVRTLDLVRTGYEPNASEETALEDARRCTRRRPTSPARATTQWCRGEANRCPSHRTGRLIRPRSLFVGGAKWGFRRVANGQVSSEKQAKSIRRMRRSQGPPPTNGGEHMGRAKKKAEKDDRTHPRP